MKKQKYLSSFILASLILFSIAGAFGQKTIYTGAVNEKAGYLPFERTSYSKTFTEPPVGKYPCYYFGYNYALTSSSLTEISILPKQRMKIVGETVPFRLSGSTLTLEDGAFAGATAHYKLDSDGKPAIIFVRKENEAKGHKIDVSDTWCYLES